MRRLQNRYCQVFKLRSKYQILTQTHGPQRNPNAGTNRNTRVDFPKTGLEQSNLINHHPEGSVHSQDNDDGYDS